MDPRAKAEELAKRPYFTMTAVDETTEGDPIYFARVLEMEGCFGQGTTREEATKDLRLAMVDFIDSLLADGLPVPEPTPLVSATLGTATQGVFTFAMQDKRLQPIERQAHRDSYVLAARAG